MRGRVQDTPEQSESKGWEKLDPWIGSWKKHHAEVLGPRWRNRWRNYNEVGWRTSVAGRPKCHYEIPWSDSNSSWPAKGEKAENGLIEEAGKTIREFVCTSISQIGYGIDDSLELDLDIIPWIVRWAAICYSRYAVGKDGRTSYERLRGRACKAIVVSMGEKVWYKQVGDGLIAATKQKLNGSKVCGSDLQQGAPRHELERRRE